MLAEADLSNLIELRRDLHRHPEISGEEHRTASHIAGLLQETDPDGLVTGLGGIGVAAIYRSNQPGPTIMLRCELDALPIEEISGNAWRSHIPGKAHLCGHDGHMAILVGVARELGRQRPTKGRVVLLFQPAEENGAGAAAVLADPKFHAIAPDYAFALHNMPGLPLGIAALSPGPAACASRGLRITLTGKTSHASVPEDGLSPMPAMSALMPALTALGRGGELDEDYSLVTITHASLGAAAFGIAPGAGEIWATLRTLLDDRMAALVGKAEALVQEAASRHGLMVNMAYEDVFHHCWNDDAAVEQLRTAFEAEGIPHGPTKPMRASEDFGLFGRNAKAAFFLIGSGETSPQLHNPDYDFPDSLIEPAVRIFLRTVRNMLG